MEESERYSEALIAEYNSLRAEALDNCRGMVNLFLYIVIIIATIFGASISKDRYEPTLFLMPLIAPLLLIRNTLYCSNVRITHYIATNICPRLPGLGWSKYLERPAQHPIQFNPYSYRLQNFWYLTIAIVPSVVFASENLSVCLSILRNVNIVIGIGVASVTLGCTRRILLKKIAKQEDEHM